MIKLIVTDMDGTFLDDNRCYDQKRFASDYALLKDKSIIFVPGSGRSLQALYHDFPSLFEELYYIAENGSCIAHGKTILKAEIMGPETCSKVLDVLDRYEHLIPVLSGRKASHLQRKHHQYAYLVDPFFPAPVIEDSFDNVDDDIYKISICNLNGYDSLMFDEITSQLPDGVHSTVTGFSWFDVIISGVNKGTGLKALQDILHITPDETMVFGDESNDLEMFEHATYSYAMANASETVKKAARYEALSNNDSGVLEIIEKLL